MESNRDLSLSSCVQHLQNPQPQNHPKMALSFHALREGKCRTCRLVLCTNFAFACEMRPQRPKWVQVRVCLEELSIVFGPRTSVPCFFSGLQETWPPCAEEPFGTGQGRGSGGGGGHRVKNVGHFKAGKQP